MLGDIPKLLTKDFFIGYVLPSATFVLLVHRLVFDMAKIGIIGAHPAAAGSQAEASEVWVYGNLLALTLGTAFLLLALNFHVIRCLEGYPLADKAPWTAGLQRRRYLRLRRELIRLGNARTVSRNQAARMQEIGLELATRYPAGARLVLPTRFGNTIRAFECYSAVMYGLDAIPGWPRLLAVVPEAFQQRLAEAKTAVDLWVNGWALSLIFAAMAPIPRWHQVAAVTGRPLTATDLAASASGLAAAVLPSVVAVLVALFFARMAASAAVGWGDWVKAAFDVYLGDLGAKIFRQPGGPDAHWRTWDAYSGAILYRLRRELPDVVMPPPADSETRR